MGPTLSEVHVNRPLTNLMVQYQQSLEAYVADKVFPIVPVQFRSDKYFTVPKDAWFKAMAEERAPATESVGINYHINSDNEYNCKVYAVHYDLADQIRKNFDSPLAADSSAMRFVVRNLMNKREKVFVDTFMQPGVWSGANATGSIVNTDYDVTADGHGAWNTDSSDPMADITDAQTYAESKTGYVLDQLTMTKDCFDALRNNASVLDRIKYTQRGVVSQDILASLLGVKRINVVRAVLNTAQTGKTANMGFIASNGWLLSYSPEAPSIQDASAGYCFTWINYLGASALGNTMTTIPMPLKKADRFEGEMCFDFRVVAPDLGVFGKNAIAPKGADGTPNTP